jgi:acyl carrier protein
MEEKIKELMADVFEIDAKAINESSNMDRIDAWGSLTHLNLCFAVEQEFAIRLEVADMELMTSFKKIVETISSKRKTL